MISELTWDSSFFKRKIGELKTRHKPFSLISTALKEAEAGGFHYLICKTELQDIGLIRFLESSGFYLSDIGITLSASTGKFSQTCVTGKERAGKSVVVATVEDIPGLRKMSKSLFPESRFYHDPFFSKEEADNLYMAWIENSVNGTAADIVFYIPREGYIACRKTRGKGQIILLGVKKGSRGKGVGTALVEEAMRWFTAQGLPSVSVRTQLTNLAATNFYLRSGFTVAGHDVVFGKIL